MSSELLDFLRCPPRFKGGAIYVNRLQSCVFRVSNGRDSPVSRRSSRPTLRTYPSRQRSGYATLKHHAAFLYIALLAITRTAIRSDRHHGDDLELIHLVYHERNRMCSSNRPRFGTHHIIRLWRLPSHGLTQRVKITVKASINPRPRIRPGREQ